MHSVEPSKNREYTAVDIAKLICALLVVAIHTEPFAGNFWLDKGFGVLTRIPVPYFFMASGYFLFLADKEKTSFAKLKKYCLRILLLYAVWSVFYLPMLFSRCMVSGVFNTSMFFKAIFWLGTQGHLWYLIASIVAAVMTWSFLRITTLKKTVIIAFIFLIFGTVFSNYAPLIHKLSSKEGGGHKHDILCAQSHWHEKWNFLWLLLCRSWGVHRQWLPYFQDENIHYCLSDFIHSACHRRSRCCKDCR